MKTNDLHTQLLGCFPPVKILANRVYDGSAERAKIDPEVQELCHFTGGKSWLEIQAKDISPLAEYISLMSDEAFIAFLPAFLEAIVEDLKAGREDTASLIISFLSPQNRNGERNAFILRKVGLLNKEQTHLVKEWLRIIEKLGISSLLMADVRRALGSYWEPMNS